MPSDLPAGVTPTYSQQYRRCGKPSCPLCAAGGCGHGPYWYAYWREGGRARSRYLGKQSPAGVALRATPQAGRPEPNAPAPIKQPAHPGLRVRTLGGFALWWGAERIAVERWERQQSGILFKWLLGAPGHRLTRDEVVERFWPDGEPEQGMANLRVLVHRLRRVLDDPKGGESALRYDGEVLTLAPGEATPDWLDAAAFDQVTQAALAGRDAGACRSALALYTGAYLPGDAYDEWALARRDELGRQRIALLLHLAALCGTTGEVEETERYLHTILTLDRCHEPAALALMRLYAGAGWLGQALSIYQRLAEALHEDLALGPEEETRALARALAARQAAAPAVVVPDLAPNNLPAPLTSFIGRRRELANLRILLQSSCVAGTVAAGADMAPCRLLTLIGPGGVGKTRLTLRLAEWLLDEPGAYPDGVWLAELASLADPALVPKRVARSLGIQEETSRPLGETLTAYLQTKRLLLLLDNCEHLLDACADLVTRLLAVCPGLRVLATSRTALGVPGEQPWLVPALSLPPAAGEAPVGRLLESEAVRLFLDRACVHRPDLNLTDKNGGAMARICRQLEGIPLALELAAARVSILSLDQIAVRLRESFGLLTGGPRTAPRRQQTLRATLDWSYDLLTAPEATLLRRLAVFVGGCTLEAAEAACAGEGLAVEEVLDLLGSLARHSLLLVDQTDEGKARYRLLEMVRQYVAEQLAASREAVWVSHQHLVWCLGLAKETRARQTSLEYPSWLQRLDADHGNMRAALGWAMLEEGDQAAGIQLVGAMWGYWILRGHLSEGRHWLDQALRRLDAVAARLPVEDRSQVLYGAAALAWSQGDSARAIALQTEHLAFQRRLGNQAATSHSSHMLGVFLLQHGDHDRAAALLEESLRFDREHHLQRDIAISLTNLGMLAFAQGDLQRALTLHQEGPTIAQGLGDTRLVAMGHSHLALLAYVLGDVAQAVARFGRSAALHWELQDPRNLADALDGVAVAGVQGDPEQSALLFGATQILRETLGAPLAPIYHTLHAQAVAAARAALGDESFAAAWLRGQALPLETVAEFASVGCGASDPD